MKERVSTEGFHLHPGSSMPVSLSLSDRVSPELWVNGPAKSAPVFPLLTRHWLWNFQRIRTHNDNSHWDISMTVWDRTTTKNQVRQSRKFDLWNMIAEICSISFKVSFSLEESAELICVSGGWGPDKCLCVTTAKARSGWFQLFGCALGNVIWSRQMNYLRVWWRQGRSGSKRVPYPATAENPLAYKEDTVLISKRGKWEI